MKNRFIKAFGYMAATSVCVLAINSSAFAAQIGIAKESINIRKIPVDVGKVVGVLYPGEKVSIVQSKLGWYYISKDGNPLGWVNGSYLNIKTTTDATVAPPATKTPSQASNANTAKVTSTPSSGTVTITQTVNVRQQPSTNSKVLAALYKGFKATIIGNQNGWLKVKMDNQTVGYVLASNVTVTNAPTVAQTKPTTGVVAQKKPVATVKVQPKVETYSQPKTAQTIIGVNVRKSPSRTAPVINSTYPGVGFYVVGKVDEWYKVKLSNSNLGYILSKYVKMSTVTASRGGSATLVAPTTKAVKPTTVTNAGLTVASDSANADGSSDSRIAFAKKYIGTPYVWGGTTPSGFDCSGFIMYVNRNFGISLQRVAAAQATQGELVDKSGLQPGDLVFFDTSGSNTGNINHVGMYIGGGQFIHASSGRGCVTISDLTGGFYASAFVRAKRVR